MPAVNITQQNAVDTLLASAARTTTGTSSEVAGFESATSLVVQLNVTAASGTSPTLDVVLQDTVDGTNWNTVATFTQATAVTRSVQRVTVPFTNRLRISYTIGGVTPSFTFSVIVYSEA